MQPEQRQRIDAAVRDVIITDFRDDFEEIFEFAYRFTGELVIQANNGIRNALSHLASALVDEDDIKADLEVARARKHVAIAKYDCLLVLVINRVEYLESYVARLEALTGQANSDLRTQLVEIKKAKNAIPEQRFIRGDSKEQILADISSISHVNNQMELLVAECNEYERYLKDNFAVPDPIRRSPLDGNPKLLRWLLENALWLLLFTFLANIIAAIIFVLWIENIVHTSPTYKSMHYGRTVLSQSAPYSCAPRRSV
jgi:hypothetical protein